MPESRHGLRLALFEPDQPGNFGAMLRLAACFGVGLEVIEPCGFPLDHRRIRRAAMDYAAYVRYRRHDDLDGFCRRMRSEGRRLVLLSTTGACAYHRFDYRLDDVLVIGSESAGSGPELPRRADAVLRIPIRSGLRSLNAVTAAAIVVAEALRSTGALDGQGFVPAGSEEGAALVPNDRERGAVG